MTSAIWSYHLRWTYKFVVFKSSNCSYIYITMTSLSPDALLHNYQNLSTVTIYYSKPSPTDGCFKTIVLHNSTRAIILLEPFNRPPYLCYVQYAICNDITLTSSPSPIFILLSAAHGIMGPTLLQHNVISHLWMLKTSFIKAACQF